MPCPHRVPANDGPPSPCFFPPLPPPGWGSGSGPGRRPSAAPLRAVASSSGHWLAIARGKRGSSTDRETGAAGPPGPPVAPQVISAPARTHVDRSRSPVRARGAPGQPAGRSVRATSIPLRLRRLGLPSVWCLPRCGSGVGGVRALASKRVSVCRGSEEGAAGKEVAQTGAPHGSSPLSSSFSIARYLVQRVIPNPRKKLINAPSVFFFFSLLKIRSPKIFPTELQQKFCEKECS